MKRVLLTLIMTGMIWSTAWAGARDISSKEARNMLENDKGIFVLDVRTPTEASMGKLPGAVLIPMRELERRISELPKNRKVLIYCAVGGRSGSASGVLSKNGYDVYNMTDGILGWYRNGFPLERK
ncbi:MAG: rhodanese-like domain-containing protein [Desulfuromonadales bacterium]